LVKTFKSGNEAKAWVMKSPGGHSIMTKKQWDVSEGTSVNEVSNPKEIAVLQKERDTLAAKGSAIMDKQRQLIRTTLGNKFEFPWENYDKWPTKLKIEVEKLNKEYEKNGVEVQKAFEKLMKAMGTWR
jgi:hypothetical protein